jgi:hypothetical protein
MKSKKYSGMNFTPRRIRIKHAREFGRGSWAILRLNHVSAVTPLVRFSESPNYFEWSSPC